MGNSNIQAGELAALIARLKRRDYGLYLSWRLSPLDVRDHLTWLYGFFMDVTQIPYKVDEPMLGEIRLHWWRDQLNRARRGERIGHPVADGLGEAFGSVAEADELLAILQAMIESLLFEVQRATIADRAELYAVFDKRHGGLIRAALIICGMKPVDFEPQCREAGLAIGLAETIAQLPRILDRGLMPIPQDLLERHKIGHEEFTKPELCETHALVLRELIEGAYATSSHYGSEGGAGNVDHETSLKYGEKALLISWDIDKRLSGMKGPARVIFGRWLLVPALLNRAMRDRLAGRMVVSSLNPLKIFFTMWRASL